MTINADYDKINTVGSSILEKKEELNILLKDLVQIVNDDIHSGWSGEVYENFKNKAITYIKNANKTINDLDYLGEYLKKSSRVYNAVDDEFDKDMKKAGVSNER